MIQKALDLMRGDVEENREEYKKMGEADEPDRVGEPGYVPRDIRNRDSEAECKCSDTNVQCGNCYRNDGDTNVEVIIEEDYDLNNGEHLHLALKHLKSVEFEQLHNQREKRDVRIRLERLVNAL